MASNDTGEIATIDELPTSHRQAFVQSLMRVLETGVAERTFAEIIDGLPTIDSYLDFHWPQEGHPATKHPELCSGMIEKARHLRSEFPPTRLNFRLSVWVDSPRDVSQWDGYRHPTVFCHSFYTGVERYPNGDADTVGYWAEAKIFGGVLVFDRGESETECKELYLHAGRRAGPFTLFPLTTEQFDTLVSFLLEDSEAPSPLPFTATSKNRWRWHTWDAMARHHIFRDKYERSIPPSKATRGVKSAVDWPEIADELYLIGAMHDYYDGQPVDKNEVRTALERLQQITPSSPVWATRNAHSWTENLFE
ncbi:hypothetical protein FBEOM_918 [Fusarium beomiforme]|uniref:Uncharacterized protein n=1 Tax=Fusarium beomiforme TaxID=44412 RepID=A0A9P5E565_9HYPO|nr:hypothetical protein FBEOM_918 [Fusarium beomiforme]